jgi:DNA polymerase beta
MTSLKDSIILNLEKLQIIYKKDPKKKWGVRAISIAIKAIKEYDGHIISGTQMKTDIKGVGEKIAIRIDEIINTGTLEELESDDKEEGELSPLEKILLITGVGPTRAKKWVNELGCKNVEDVKKAIEEEKIKSTHHIDIGIKYYDDFQQKIPRVQIDVIKGIFSIKLKEINEKLIFEICGSYRRNLPESGDIDILVSHPDYMTEIDSKNFLGDIVKLFIKLNMITDCLTMKGKTKFMGVFKLPDNPIARRIDIRLVDYSSYYTSILYFTGNKDFNVYLRQKALDKKYSLNEYTLTDIENNSFVDLKSECEIFDILEIPYVKPEERNY